MVNCGQVNGYPCRAGPCLKKTWMSDNNNWFRVQYYRTQKINKQVRMSSSQNLLRKKTLNVTRWLAQGEQPTTAGGAGSSMNAGGTGDRVHSVQVSTRSGIRGNKARTEKRGDKGVDKKHDSYARYLARKTGKVLRNSTSETVVEKTTVIANKRTINKTGIGSPAGLWFNFCCRSDAVAGPPGRLGGN